MHQLTATNTQVAKTIEKLKLLVVEASSYHFQTRGFNIHLFSDTYTLKFQPTSSIKSQDLKKKNVNSAAIKPFSLRPMIENTKPKCIKRKINLQNKTDVSCDYITGFIFTSWLQISKPMRLYYFSPFLSMESNVHDARQIYDEELVCLQTLDIIEFVFVYH